MAANEKESFKVSGQWGEEELTVGTVCTCVCMLYVYIWMCLEGQGEFWMCHVRRVASVSEKRAYYSQLLRGSTLVGAVSLLA